MTAIEVDTTRLPLLLQELRLLPARERQAEVVEPMIERRAGDRDFRHGGGAAVLLPCHPQTDLDACG
jgi:hypothetical protein